MTVNPNTSKAYYFKVSYANFILKKVAVVISHTVNKYHSDLWNVYNLRKITKTSVNKAFPATFPWQTRSQNSCKISPKNHPPHGREASHSSAKCSALHISSCIHIYIRVGVYGSALPPRRFTILGLACGQSLSICLSRPRARTPGITLQSAKLCARGTFLLPRKSRASGIFGAYSRKRGMYRVGRLEPRWTLTTNIHYGFFEWIDGER